MIVCYTDARRVVWMKNVSLQKRMLHVFAMLLVAGMAFPLFGCSSAAEAAKTILVTEVVSSNKHALVDEDVGSPDWIELYNPSAVAVDLSGYGLSDNMRNFHKYVFPDGTVIGAGEYLVVYAGDNNGVRATSVPCTGFGLSKSGDYLFLTDPYYELIVEMQIPSLATDVAYARRSDGSFGYTGATTPGAPNKDDDIRNTLSEIFNDQDFSAVMISEVMPSSADEGPWVELYNSSDNPMRLDNYYLSDSAANLMRFQLPESIIQPHGYAIVYLSGQQTGEHELESTFKLSSSDNALYLSSIDGVLLSELSWQLDLPAGLSVVAEQGGMYTAHATRGEPNSAELFELQASSEMDASDPIRINEVLQQNRYSIIDADGDRNEWVELHNNSDAPISLGGYFLSDTADDLFRFALPDVTVEAGGYCLIFLSGKDRTDGEIHANFGLGIDETMLYLTDIKRMRTDMLPLLSEDKSNVSVGRDTDGTVRYYAQPTPGSENAKGFETADVIGFFNKESVFISEVCSINKASSKRNDWVELYNGSNADIDLSGWYLSDSIDEPDRWRFADGTVIGTGKYLVVETTSHTVRQKNGVATLGLSAAGEAIVLSDSNGVQVDVFLCGALSTGITCGRIEDDPFTERVYFTSATKGKPNSESTRAGYAPQPIFSDTSLYHAEPFTAVISCASDDAAIYYTTNGDTPTERSNRYEGPIEIGKNTVLRAIAYEEGKLPSEISAVTYLFETPHTLPVVTIAIDRDDFSDVSSAKKSDKPERAAQISYYEADGSLGISFPAGLKAKGSGTLGYAQKSFTLNLRGGYGRSSVTYPFFENCAFNTFSALVLRNSGQDIDEARMRDSLFSRMMKGMNLDYAETRPVIAYINGRYWGIYDFNEELNSEYLETHYGVDSDAVDFIKRNETELKGSNDGYLKARSWGQNKNLAKDDLFAQYAEMVDVAYCTDYIIAQTYIINSDMFNQKFWHSKDNTVKWRPVFYDLDWGMNEESSIRRSLFKAYFSEEGIPSANGSLTNLDVFVGLRKNKAWRQQFTERYVELVCGQLSAESTLAVFDELYGAIEPEMQRHIDRWGYHDDMDDWNDHAMELRERLEQRPAAVLKNLQDFMRLSDADMEALIEKYSSR